MFSVLLFSSCEKWFDVQPKSEVKLDKMFNTETGFKNALIGSYILISSTQLYGREMNVTFMDAIAQQYDMHTTNDYYDAKQYKYKQEKQLKKIDGFWSKSYNAIANLNAIIGEIDPRKEVLHPTAYGYIKGEALGLRAFLHFDLLRMFSVGGLESRKSMLNSASIPYVTMYDKGITTQSTVEQVLQLIEKDLLAAEKLLDYYDLYGTLSKDPDFELPDELFFDKDYRRSRFNYLAVKATQARMYMWWGKYDEAKKAAAIFVKAENPPVSWINITADILSDESSQDYRNTREAIFRVDAYKFFENIKKYTETFKIDGDFNTQKNDQYFFHKPDFAQELYESNTIGRSDFRFANLYENSTSEYLFYKFRETNKTNEDVAGRVPLIKKSEMFYITAECALRAGDLIEAIRLINEVRVNRGIKYADNLPNTLTAEQVKTEIEKEYRKEFVGEGVMFFYYKRLNEAIPNSQQNAEDKIFVFPLPATEVEIGNRIEIVETL